MRTDELPTRARAPQLTAEAQAHDGPDLPGHLSDIGLDAFAPYLMNRIMGRYNAALREEMAALGLSTPQMRAIAVLSVRDGLQIGRLAVYAVVEQSTLSRALDQLERDGKVRRVPDPADSRATCILLTPAGHADFARLWPHMAESYTRMFSGIDDEEKRAFVGTLRKMLANIRRNEF
ncbi:MAG: MarR family transcriptional regulator [Rhodobacteraceae bacterium]|nr:MarR family transcriptional regulator [Paracoccaceae bacterium]